MGKTGYLGKIGYCFIFSAMGNTGYMYDAGCVTNQYDQQLNYKWPFTYDFPPTENLCTTGTSPTLKYPGNGVHLPHFTFLSIYPSIYLSVCQCNHFKANVIFMSSSMQYV